MKLRGYSFFLGHFGLGPILESVGSFFSLSQIGRDCTKIGDDFGEDFENPINLFFGGVSAQTESYAPVDLMSGKKEEANQIELALFLIHIYNLV